MPKLEKLASLFSPFPTSARKLGGSDEADRSVLNHKVDADLKRRNEMLDKLAGLAREKGVEKPREPYISENLVIRTRKWMLTWKNYELSLKVVDTSDSGSGRFKYFYEDSKEQYLALTTNGEKIAEFYKHISSAHVTGGIGAHIESRSGEGHWEERLGARQLFDQLLKEL